MREYEDTTLQRPKSADAEATQSQSTVVQPDVHRQGPLQDQSPAESMQPLSGGYLLSVHIPSVLREQLL